MMLAPETLADAVLAALVIDFAKRLPRRLRLPAWHRRAAGEALPGVFALPVNYPQQVPTVKARMLAADRLWLQAVRAAA
jgi:hypothetical protein